MSWYLVGTKKIVPERICGTKISTGRTSCTSKVGLSKVSGTNLVLEMFVLPIFLKTSLSKISRDMFFHFTFSFYIFIFVSQIFEKGGLSKNKQYKHFQY